MLNKCLFKGIKCNINKFHSFLYQGSSMNKIYTISSFLSNSRMYTYKKPFTTKLNNSIDHLSSNLAENPEEEPIEFELREIQKSPKYEAAIGFVVAGDYERGIKILKDLQKNIRSENNHISGDYLFLLKKIVSFNKIAKYPISNIEILNEISEISKKIYSTDFNNLFDNTEYTIINLLEIDPTQAIKFTNEILEENIFPGFFDHIFKYYLGSAYVLEGKSLEVAVEIFNAIENEIDDKYLKCCVLNNKACALWWDKLRYYINEIEKNQAISYELVDQIAKEVFSIVKVFKNGLIQIEDLENLKYEDRINYEGISTSSEKSEDIVRKNFLKYLLTINFDISKKFDSNFVKEFGQFNNPITTIKTSAIVFSNLGELYFNVREYQKSLMFLNVANLFFQNFQKNDPLFYKNLALVALCNWKLTGKSENPKNMFDKIINQLKQYPNCYEKVFVLRSYGEMLAEENSQNIYANNLLEEAKIIEEKLPYFECRRNYLTLPRDE